MLIEPPDDGIAPQAGAADVNAEPVQRALVVTKSLASGL
jgi:hypothetical protein